MSINNSFQDRSKGLFGRKTDVLSLMNRISVDGFTAIAAPPLMGKSWLLEEVARRAHEQGALVGYHECKGENDHLLHVTCDLYTRWLANATVIAQAKSILKRHSGNWITRVGSTVGQLLEVASTFTGIPTHIYFSRLVNTHFQQLVLAQKDLNNAGIGVHPITYDQIKELLSILQQVSNSTKILLIMDAWEKSPSYKIEHATLSTVLKHHNEWRYCHILAGLRQPDPDSPADSDAVYKLANALHDLSPGAKVMHLGPMDFSDIHEHEQLIAHIRMSIPAAQYVNDAEILSMIAGLPGVLGRWLHDSNRINMASRDDMQHIADEAHSYHYGELRALLPTLSPPQLKAAIRLAFFPRLSSETWIYHKDVILHGVDDCTIDELTLLRVLESQENESNYPTYGHDTRHSTAQRWFLETMPLRATIRREIEEIVFQLATRITTEGMASYQYSAVLASLDPVTNQLNLSHLTKALSAASTTLFLGKVVPGIFLDVSHLRLHEDLSSLLALGISNAIVFDIDDDKQAIQVNLLQELRNLHDLFPGNNTVIGMLAVSLSNYVRYTQRKKSRRATEALLAELRELHIGHPKNELIAERFGGALTEFILPVNSSSEFKYRQARFDELQALFNGIPHHNRVREHLATAVYNLHIHATNERRLSVRDKMFDQLTQLRARWDRDNTVRRLYSMCLLNSLLNSKEDGNLQKRDQYLNQLRALHQQAIDDESVREQLAKGLFNTTNHATDEKNWAQRDGLIIELRNLSGCYPKDPVVRKQLVMSIFNALFWAQKEGKPLIRNQFLDELRSMHRDYPEDECVRENLAVGLYYCMHYTKAEDNLIRRDELLNELRTLRNNWPHDKKVLQAFGDGILLTLRHFNSEAITPSQRTSLFEELQAEQDYNPITPARLEATAMDMSAEFQEHLKVGDKMRAKQILDNLSRWADRYPEVDAIRTILLQLKDSEKQLESKSIYKQPVTKRKPRKRRKNKRKRK